SKIRISHILQEKNMVSLRFSHFVKTIENPREEMLMGNFFVILESLLTKTLMIYILCSFFNSVAKVRFCR
ncbi:MAG TPA: hypothetical protein VLR29_02260, partial [Flavobacterium sp.]|nr:hypothetical protein [Flavobacterium sp.]